MPTVNVNIQPAILNWALDQTNEEKLGKKLAENIKHWLDGSKCPTFNQIEEFSKKTHRSFCCMLLRNAPCGCNVRILSPSRPCPGLSLH